MRNRQPRPITGREPEMGEGLYRHEARLGGSAALLHTVEMLGHEDPQVRYRAAFTLAEVDDERAVDNLLRLLLSAESRTQRVRAARALGRVGRGEAVTALALVVHSGEHWRLRGAAAEALGRIAVRLDAQGVTDWAAVEMLNAALGDDVYFVRVKAARALGEVGGPVVDLLLTALADEHVTRREAAAWALGRAGDRRAIEPLLGALDDPHEWVRRAAAEALGTLGDPAAVPALTAHLSDNGADRLGRVCDAADDALRRIGTREK